MSDAGAVSVLCVATVRAESAEARSFAIGSDASSAGGFVSTGASGSDFTSGVEVTVVAGARSDDGVVSVADVGFDVAWEELGGAEGVVCAVLADAAGGAAGGFGGGLDGDGLAEAAAAAGVAAAPAAAAPVPGAALPADRRAHV